MAPKYFMHWSGGKDSALALYKAAKQGIVVEALVTAVNSSTNRISMHGVRRELLEAQATALGLPLYTIGLPEMPDMATYEKAVSDVHAHLKTIGYTHALFGDIFLEDLKAYRETLLTKDGLQCLFPIWKEDSRALLQTFIQSGFQAIVICINSEHLDKSFCGRLLNESFVHDLPAATDPCGENGEYHSFVFDGPLFCKPVDIIKGEIFFKEYAAPKRADGIATPQAATGFYFQDLMIR